MSVLATIACERRGDVVVATVVGEIDGSNAHEIGEELERLASNRTTALVVDLDATEYLDSAGINVLFELGASLRTHQQRLHLVVAPGAPIARMLSIAGLALEERTYDVLDDALLHAGAD